MTINQKTINWAAAIIQNTAEPNFNHTNQAGALFVKAQNIIFSAAGVSGFEKALEKAEEQDQGSDQGTHRSMTGIG